ncbi:MAG TPA: response regulator [Bdellovibrionota bacterium]|jgi:two-component system chemotaxis response regulator CheY|nr:response regulator [Bdellovibrionota bacterium]
MTDEQPFEARPRSEMHVLLVDDDDQVRKVTEDFLRHMGYQKITVCENGADALRTLQKDPTIELIISDWDMPLMDGHSLLQQVRSQARLQHLPFVIITSPKSQETDKVMMAAEGMVDAYIVKPFRLNTLQEKLDTVLQLSAHGPQKTVVVTDDDPEARAVVVEYLKNFGFKKIRTFENGEDAFTFMADHPAELGLIIADWEMPKMTGVELLVACKNRTSLKDIPFLIITSQNSMETLKVTRAGQSSVDSYLLKPFTGDVLKERIDSAIFTKRNSKIVQQYGEEGFQNLDRGHFKAARTSFEKALKLDPKYSDGFEGMGDLQMKSGSPANAIPIYQKAVAINPYAVKHYLKLSHAYEAVGELGKALSLMQVALQYVENPIDIRFNLARLYQKKNILYKAMEELQEVVKLDPSRQSAQQLLEAIQIDIERSKASGKPPSEE